jgi:signal peptidase I
MEATFFQRHPLFKDIISIGVFALLVILGTIFINHFVFKSFNVVGPSMEPTFYTNDRLIVNRLPVAWSQLLNKTYIPERGEIVVFKNPSYSTGLGDEHLVKRVIALPGERVVLENGTMTVYNDENPEGFNPDAPAEDGSASAVTSGSGEWVVPEGEIFIVGDHRDGSFSYDSRNGLGTVPLYDVVGPVGLQIFPFDKIRFF